jgi:predicted house-cleaning noncanonical NTP pyrophosphatase (MazG superfamily)
MGHCEEHMKKLVRDKIPEIMRAAGKKNFQVHEAGNAEYIAALLAKLHEEINEYDQDHSPEELADILEVVHALADQCYGGFSAVEQIRQQKAKERGGFSKKIIVTTND